MLDVFRFKRYYKRLIREKRNESGEWEVALQDVRDLLDRIPLSVVRKFDQSYVRYLRNYHGVVYHQSTDDLLEAIREAAVSIRTNSYIDNPVAEPAGVGLNLWIQPTPVACNFGNMLVEFQRAFGELVDAYNNAPSDKVGYYQRRTYGMGCDVMSLAEMLAELITARVETHA